MAENASRKLSLNANIRLSRYAGVTNTFFNAIRENKILTKISRFAVVKVYLLLKLHQQQYDAYYASLRADQEKEKRQLVKQQNEDLQKASHTASADERS